MQCYVYVLGAVYMRRYNEHCTALLHAMCQHTIKGMPFACVRSASEMTSLAAGL